MDNNGTSGTQNTQNSDQGSSDSAWEIVSAYLSQMPVTYTTDPSQCIQASAASQKLVERAVSVIPRLENGTMYWSWRAVVEFELGKYTMPESDRVAAIHHTLNTTVRTNLHGRHSRLWECWRKLTVPQALELIRDASSAPSKTDYARAILEGA